MKSNILKDPYKKIPFEISTKERIGNKKPRAETKLGFINGATGARLFSKTRFIVGTNLLVDINIELKQIPVY
jgi:hypothetical protein